MNDPAISGALLRWFAMRGPEHFKERVAEGAFDDARIEMAEGYRYSSYTFEDASVKVVFTGPETPPYEFDLDDFWPDGTAKLGEFVEQVVALMAEVTA